MKVIVQELAINYRDEGLGGTILLLHGWQNNLNTFDKIARLLTESFRIVRLDLPGFGESESPSKDWDLNAYVKFVEDFIRKLDLKPEAIIGHSFGGRIIIKSRGVFGVKKNILIASAGVAKRDNFRNKVMKGTSMIIGPLLKIPPLSLIRGRIRAWFYDKIKSDYLRSESMKGIFVKVISENLADDCSKIRVPTLLIWGRDDSETPLSEGKTMSQIIPNSKLEVINKAGHFVHQYHPETVANLIKSFL
jgi:pimeloyl-ACP methyl ester carboxylesterase